MPGYRRHGRRASPASPPASAAFDAFSRLRPPNAAARRRRQPPPAAANRRLLPRAAARHGHLWPVVRRRPSPVVRRRPSSPVAVPRRRHRPPSPVAGRRRSSPIVATAAEDHVPPSSTCVNSRLAAGTLCADVSVTFSLRRPHTAAHGGRDPPRDDSTASPFVAVSASADFLSSDSCVRYVSAHAGVVRLTAVTCGQRSCHRGVEGMCG